MNYKNTNSTNKIDASSFSSKNFMSLASNWMQTASSYYPAVTSLLVGCEKINSTLISVSDTQLSDFQAMNLPESTSQLTKSKKPFD